MSETILPLGQSFRYGSLRSLRESDVPGMLTWMHDPGTAVMFARDFMSATEADTLAFIRSSWLDSSSAHLAVAGADESYLGTVSLKGADARNRRAEYAVAMIPEARGTGAALRGTCDLIALAFKLLDLHSVFLNVRADNERAIRFYEKVGFIREGVSREAICSEGVFADLAWYSMLERELGQSAVCIGTEVMGLGHS